jgi:serine protease AprX
MGSYKRILGLVLLLWTGELAAQVVHRYMVFFKDKDGSPYSVSQPLEFLSQRALDRRAHHNVSVTEQDFPVNAEYVQGLKDIEGVDVFFTTRWFNGALVQMDPNGVQANERLDAVLALGFVDRVEFIAPNAVLTHTQQTVDIPETFTAPAATSLSSATQVNMLGAQYLHAEGFRGEGMLIGVFDGGFTGVNLRQVFAHLHTNNRMLGIKDFVKNTGNPYQYDAHGTSALSCIAAKNGSLFTGTAPEAHFLLAVTEEVATEYRVEEYNWLLAAEWADSVGVDVINTSLGYSDFDNSSMNYSTSDMDGLTAVITIASELAAARGILVVNSAGNSGGSSWNIITAPADGPNVLAVGAVNSTGTKASFSSFGPTADGRIKPDVSAMGVSTVVVGSSGSFGTANGTSFSSPLMAGFAAIVWQANPELTNVQVMELIKSWGHLAANPNNSLGYGIPTYTSDVVLGENERTVTWSVFPNPFANRVTVSCFPCTNVDYQLIGIDGKVLSSGQFNLTKTLDTSALSPGMYFLQMTGQGVKEVVKLVRE